MIYFSLSADEPVVVSHRKQGGRAVFIRNENLVLASGAEEVLITGVAVVALAGPAPRGGVTEAILAAVSAAWALNIAPDLIGAGIETFEYDDSRFNAGG